MSIEPDHSPGGEPTLGRCRASQREAGASGPKRPGWPFLIAGGLIYAGALLTAGLALLAALTAAALH